MVVPEFRIHEQVAYMGRLQQVESLKIDHIGPEGFFLRGGGWNGTSRGIVVSKYAFLKYIIYRYICIGIMYTDHLIIHGI